MRTRFGVAVNAVVVSMWLGLAVRELSWAAMGRAIPTEHLLEGFCWLIATGGYAMRWRIRGF